MLFQYTSTHSASKQKWTRAQAGGDRGVEFRVAGGSWARTAISAPLPARVEGSSIFFVDSDSAMKACTFLAFAVSTLTPAP